MIKEIRLGDFPELKRILYNMPIHEAITEEEAYAIYKDNCRFIWNTEESEKILIRHLASKYGKGLINGKIITEGEKYGKIRVDSFPELHITCWSYRDDTELDEEMVYGQYRNSWRFVSEENLTAEELELIDYLTHRYGNGGVVFL